MAPFPGAGGCSLGLVLSQPCVLPRSHPTAGWRVSVGVITLRPLWTNPKICFLVFAVEIPHIRFDFAQGHWGNDVLHLGRCGLGVA